MKKKVLMAVLSFIMAMGLTIVTVSAQNADQWWPDDYIMDVIRWDHKGIYDDFGDPRVWGFIQGQLLPGFIGSSGNGYADARGIWGHPQFDEYWLWDQWDFYMPRLHRGQQQIWIRWDIEADEPFDSHDENSLYFVFDGNWFYAWDDANDLYELLLDWGLELYDSWHRNWDYWDHLQNGDIIYGFIIRPFDPDKDWAWMNVDLIYWHGDPLIYNIHINGLVNDFWRYELGVDITTIRGLRTGMWVDEVVELLGFDAFVMEWQTSDPIFVSPAEMAAIKESTPWAWFFEYDDGYGYIMLNEFFALDSGLGQWETWIFGFGPYGYEITFSFDPWHWDWFVSHIRWHRDYYW